MSEDDLVPGCLTLSVVIPTRNRPASVARVARLLAEQARQAPANVRVEIVVVDDASRRRAAKKLAGLPAIAAPFLRLVALTGRGGAGQARNMGLASSTGDIVAFLDDDIVPADRYLVETVEEHRRHPEALVVNGHLDTRHGDRYARFWLDRYRSVFGGADGNAEPFRRISALSSGHFSIKRTLVERVSPLFDPALTSREDLDLFLRLEQAGVAVYKSDRILAWNEPRGTWWAMIRQQAWYGRGEYALRQKHPEERIASAQRRARIRAPKPSPWLELSLGLAFEASLRFEAFRRERDPRALWRGVGLVRLLRAPGRFYRRFQATRARR